MPVIFKPKRSFVPGNVPTNLDSGEMAVNVPDRKIWVADNSNIPRLMIGTPVALADLADVAITYPNTSEALTYISGKYISADPNKIKNLIGVSVQKWLQNNNKVVN